MVRAPAQPPSPHTHAPPPHLTLTSPQPHRPTNLTNPSLPLPPPLPLPQPHPTQVANLADEEIPQIYATCGRGARSTLRVLRPGLAVTGKAAAGWRGGRGRGGASARQDLVRRLAPSQPRPLLQLSALPYARRPAPLSRLPACPSCHLTASPAPPPPSPSLPLPPFPPLPQRWLCPRCPATPPLCGPSSAALVTSTMHT